MTLSLACCLAGSLITCAILAAFLIRATLDIRLLRGECDNLADEIADLFQERDRKGAEIDRLSKANAELRQIVSSSTDYLRELDEWCRMLGIPVRRKR